MIFSQDSHFSQIVPSKIFQNLHMKEKLPCGDPVALEEHKLTVVYHLHLLKSLHQWDEFSPLRSPSFHCNVEPMPTKQDAQREKPICTRAERSCGDTELVNTAKQKGSLI